jgi:hypothetical protein
VCVAVTCVCVRPLTGLQTPVSIHVPVTASGSSFPVRNLRLQIKRLTSIQNDFRPDVLVCCPLLMYLFIDIILLLFHVPFSRIPTLFLGISYSRRVSRQTWPGRPRSPCFCASTACQQARGLTFDTHLLVSHCRGPSRVFASETR